MKTIALFNLKGGVGKTAAAVNIAFQAAAGGLDTVLWDLDAQGAASWYLLGDGAKAPIKRVFRQDVPLGKALKHSAYPRLDVIPSAFSNRNADLLLSEMGIKRKLLARLARPLSEAYRLLVFDCPPSLSLLADHIFHAADAIVVPLIPTPLSLRAFVQVRDYLRKRGFSELKLLPFFFVAEDRVGLLNLLEFLRGGLVVRLCVGVILLREFAVGSADFIRGGVLADAERLVINRVGHV